jgi:hypothetical protein
MDILNTGLLFIRKHFLVSILSYLLFYGLHISVYAATNTHHNKHVATHKTRKSTKLRHSTDVHNPKMQLPWSLEIGIGYGNYKQMYRGDGQTVLARIGIAKEFIHFRLLRAGVEMGVQSGNSARLAIPQTILNALGGLTVESIMKPTLDILLTSQLYSQHNNSVFALIKAGVILRQWQFNRGSVNDLTKIYPEFQLGMGVDISQSLRLSVSYQGIVGKNPNFQIISQDCLANVAGIPWENGIILGLSVLFDSGFAQ